MSLQTAMTMGMNDRKEDQRRKLYGEAHKTVPARSLCSVSMESASYLGSANIQDLELYRYK